MNDKGTIKYNSEYKEYYFEFDNGTTYQILPDDINYMLENDINNFLNKKINFTFKIHQKLNGKVIYVKLNNLQNYL